MIDHHGSAELEIITRRGYRRVIDPVIVLRDMGVLAENLAENYKKLANESRCSSYDFDRLRVQQCEDYAERCEAAAAALLFALEIMASAADLEPGRKSVQEWLQEKSAKRAASATREAELCRELKIIRGKRRRKE